MNIYKHIIPILMLISLTLLSACMDDDVRISPPEEPDTEINKVNIEIFTRSGNYDIPSTRGAGAQENDIEKTPYVLVFSGNGGSATFIEAVRTIEFSGINKRYVVLTKQATGTFQILILANNQTHFYFDGTRHEFTEDNLNLYLEGKTLSYVSENMRTEKLDNPNTTVPYTSNDWSSLLPMSYLLEVTGGINENTKLGEPESTGTGPLLLTRGVARIIFMNELENGGDYFRLTGIMSISNVPDQAKIFNLNGIPASGTSLTHIAKTNYGSVIAETANASYNPKIQTNWGSPVYIYESLAANSTFFILKGDLTSDFGNGTETRTFYYKMDAFDSGQSYFNLQRNHEYTFKINRVKGAGYNTVADAIAAPPNNMTLLEYSVIKNDLSSHHIITNGNYYLATTNSMYITYTDAPSGPHHAFSIVTDYFSKWGSATTGNYIKPSAGITCDVAVIPNSVSPSNPLDVNISFDDNTTTGQIEICIGNLILFVKVERKAALPSTMIAPLAFYDYYKNPSASQKWWQYKFYSVNASVDDRNNGKTWIKLAPGIEKAPAAAESYAGSTPQTFAPDPVKIPDVTDKVTSSIGKIQIFIGNNQTGNPREGTFYLTTGLHPYYPAQRGVERIKFDIKQL